MSTDPLRPPSQARDIITFGHEAGRVMSDGTIIGRPEPFAKVFPSSRRVKRTVGVMAWAILEDIALDAHLDVEGRLVADTNVRRIADNLGVSKNTVATHLTSLREAGFVLHEEGNQDAAGRYTTSRYVLDPSACVERFTHTPSPTCTDSATPTADHDLADTRPHGDEPNQPDAVKPANGVAPATTTTQAGSGAGQPVTEPVVDNPASTDRAESVLDFGFGPCTKYWDTDEGTVSQSVGHRELGHKNKEEVLVQEEQHRAREAPAAGQIPAADLLVTAGINPTRAANLASRHPLDRIRDAVDAVTTQEVDNPAGWIIAALNDRWDIADLVATARRERQRHARARRRQADRRHADQTAARRDRDQQNRSQGWADIAAATLDVDRLARVIDHLQDPRFPASTRSVRMTKARVIGWVADACQQRPDLEPADAIAQALGDPANIETLDRLPPPPGTEPPPTSLPRSIVAALHQVEQPQADQPERDSPTATPPDPADHPHEPEAPSVAISGSPMAVAAPRRPGIRQISSV